MSDYEGRDRRKWHVKKEISIGDGIAILSAAIAIIYAWNTLDKRISALEQNVAFQQFVDRKQDETQNAFKDRIDKALATINLKLDTLIREAKR